MFIRVDAPIDLFLSIEIYVPVLIKLLVLKQINKIQHSQHYYTVKTQLKSNLKKNLVYWLTV